MSRYRSGKAVAMKRGSFRDSIRKTVALLTRDRVEVLFRGFQPCVMTQGDKVIRMVLPEVGDDAPEELIEAMHGFLDHECGHIFYTEFARAQQLGQGDPMKACLLNIVEDIRLEKLLPRDLPGTKDNLERMYEAMIEKFWGTPIQKQIEQGAPAERMLSVCLVVAFRGLSGQKVFHAYMDKHNLWPFMTPLLTRYPDLGKDLSSLETYDDVVACVEKVIAALPAQSKQAMDDDAKAQQAQMQQDEDDDQAPPPSKPKKSDNDDDGDDEGEGDPQEGQGSGSDDSDEDDADNGDGDGEGGDRGDDEGNSSEGDDADEGEGGAGDESDEGAGDGEGDDDSEDEADKKSKGGKGHGDGEGEDDGSDEEGGECKGDADEANPDHDGHGSDTTDLDADDDGDGAGGGKSNRTITDAVKSLDATSRRVLYLHKQKRRSIGKIAERMMLSEDEVKVILGKARRSIADYMMGDK